MRTTLSQQIQSALRYMNSSSLRLSDAQERAATGKRILKCSDDVAGTNRALSLRSAINQTEQLANNIDVNQPLLKTTMSTLDDLVDLVQKVQTEATAAANSDWVGGTKETRIANLKALLGEMKDLANAKHLDQYIFSGTATDAPAVTEQPSGTYVYSGSGNVRQTQILPWVTMPTGITGSTVFNFDGSAGAGTTDLFTMVTNVIDAIEAGDPDQVSAQLTNISDNLDNLLTCDAKVGSWSSRMESAQTALSDTSLRLQEMLSNTEDVDLAEAVVELKTQETVYETALSVCGEILNMSLASSKYLG